MMRLYLGEGVGDPVRTLTQKVFYHLLYFRGTYKNVLQHVRWYI